MIRKKGLLVVLFLLIFPLNISYDATSGIEIRGSANNVKTLSNYMKALLLEDVFWVYAVESINISGVEIPAGTSAIVISLKNYDDSPVYNITVDFNELLMIAECNDTVQQYNSTIPPGYAVTFVFKVSLRDNATASEYDLPLKVSYFKNNDNYWYYLVVPISVSGVPIIKIKAFNVYVDGSGIYDLFFEVQNIGTSPARRVVAALISSPPYVNSYGDDWKYLGIIPANKTKTCSFKIYVSEMPVSSIPIIINVSFMDQRTNNFYSITESVLVVYNETPHIILTSSSYIPTSVFPGDKFVKLSLTISNPTSKMIENASAELVLGNEFKASYAMSTKISIGTILPGQVTNLNFFIDVNDDAEPGLKNLFLIVRFSGGVNTFKVPIIIKEKAKFVITSYSPETLPRGGRGIVFRIGLKNVGNVDAEAIYLQLMGGTILKGEVVTYVGKLISGEETCISFTVEVSNSAPLGEVSLDLKITWTQENRVLSEISKLFVVIVSGSPISSVYGLTLGLISLIAGILLIPLIREIKKFMRGG